MDRDDDRAWLAEEACRNAWPAPRELHLGGWLLRQAGGPTRRTNSVNPLRGPRTAPDAAVALCEAVFAGLERPAIFRITSIAPEMDPVLERQGYAAEGHALTLLSDLDAAAPTRDPALRLTPEPDAAWLALRGRLNRTDAEAEGAYRAMVASLSLPRTFAALTGPEGILSMGYGVIDRDLVVIESVATPERWRGRGHARRTVAALMAWGRARGAKAACLQVMAGNAPARALYAGLGFRHELSRYHYRRRHSESAA